MSIQKEAEALVYAQTYTNPEQAYNLMAKVRKEKPVCWVEPEGYSPLWLVSKAEDIRYIETNTDLFLAEPRTTIATIEDQAALDAIDWGETGRGLPSMDGELHRKFRNVTRDWFMPRNLGSLDQMVADTAKAYVDLLESKAPTCDFATDVAFWYPLRVVLSLAGIPEEDDLKIITMTQQLFGHEDDNIMSNENLSQTEAIAKFFEYLAPIIEERKGKNGTDLISVIVNSEIDGEPMDLAGILGYLLIVVTAGHDTTSASLAGGLLTLMEHPEQMQMLRDNPDLIPNAASEIIRWIAPVKHFARTAAEDVEVGGQNIAKGDTLMLIFSSGARDEELIVDADKFRIDRKANKHTALGFGAHMCLGQHLAKMEVAAYLKELLPRLESIELDGEPQYLASNFVSGLKSMPVKFKFK